MFDFRETEAFKTEYDSDGEALSVFADAGYESANFIVNLGPIFFLPFGFILLTLLRKLFICIVK